jgi:hypothetical protein
MPDSQTPENKRHDECNRKDNKKVLSSRDILYGEGGVAMFQP